MNPSLVAGSIEVHRPPRSYDLVEDVEETEDWSTTGPSGAVTYQTLTNNPKRSDVSHRCVYSVDVRLI